MEYTPNLGLKLFDIDNDKSAINFSEWAKSINDVNRSMATIIDSALENVETDVRISQIMEMLTIKRI